MGNAGSKSSFEENNWRKIQSKGFRSILYNDITMKSLEQHESIISKSTDQIQQLYKWRSHLSQEFCVVDLYEYGVKETSSCSGEAQVYTITQRIHLLQNIGSYSKAEAFCILLDISKGLDILFKRFGSFTPRLDCIGINSEGRAKIWIHQNFSQLEPRQQYIPVDKSELTTVNNIIRLVASKVYQDTNFPIEYPRNLNFEGVRRYVKEVFQNLKGFQVDRVYLDRTEFKRKYRQLREFEEKEEKSRTIASEAVRRLQQIQELHEKLKKQQMELSEKEKMLTLNKLVQPIQPHRQYTGQVPPQRYSEPQKYIATPRWENQENPPNRQSQLVQNLPNRQSQPVQNLPHRQSQVQLQFLPNRQSQVQLQFLPNRQSQKNINPPQIGNRQSLPNQLSLFPTHQQQRLPAYISFDKNQKPLMNTSQSEYKIFPKSIFQPGRNQQPKQKSKMQKQIEMVDSMILYHNEHIPEENKRYEESRMIFYKQ